MAYMLKAGQETFEIVDGPHAGKIYFKEGQYDSIPEAESHRFETVKAVKTVLPQTKKPDTESVQEPVLIPDPAPIPELDIQPIKKGAK